MSWAALTKAVAERASERCEYCTMNQFLQGGTFHVDHIVPQSRGGSDDLDNLCFACPTCNGLKRAVVCWRDPAGGKEVPLYDPRRDVWVDNFAWDGVRIVGRTPTGRATVELLDFNSERKLRIRAVEVALGLLSIPQAEKP